MNDRKIIARLNAIIHNQREEIRHLQWALHRERNPIAIAIETEGQDREDGLGAEHESAGPQDIAQTQVRISNVR